LPAMISETETHFFDRSPKVSRGLSAAGLLAGDVQENNKKNKPGNNNCLIIVFILIVAL
jgi:hypothetical protein